ncbi:hypothetical protein ACFQDN_22100 [Pseudomonas asuensis]|uniref:Uncharacterized protein n=2 Tax=Pseudomonas asuensis TaxID=1825787 RepID=A0ABQ2H2K7_9PSED|nr:hypothetical protein GCM10009425_40640 [Pseudomonas asuensis]
MKRPTRADIEELRKAFKEFPPPKRDENEAITKAELIEGLYDDLQCLVEMGHSWNAISNFIMERMNMDIPAMTLKTYMGKIRNKRNQSGKKRAKTAPASSKKSNVVPITNDSASNKSAIDRQSSTRKKAAIGSASSYGESHKNSSFTPREDSDDI